MIFSLRIYVKEASLIFFRHQIRQNSLISIIIPLHCVRKEKILIGFFFVKNVLNNSLFFSFQVSRHCCCIFANHETYFSNHVKVIISFLLCFGPLNFKWNIERLFFPPVPCCLIAIVELWNRASQHF